MEASSLGWFIASLKQEEHPLKDWPAMSARSVSVDTAGMRRLRGQLGETSRSISFSLADTPYSQQGPPPMTLSDITTPLESSDALEAEAMSTAATDLPQQKREKKKRKSKRKSIPMEGGSHTARRAEVRSLSVEPAAKASAKVRLPSLTGSLHRPRMLPPPASLRARPHPLPSSSAARPSWNASVATSDTTRAIEAISVYGSRPVSPPRTQAQIAAIKQVEAERDRDRDRERQPEPQASGRAFAFAFPLQQWCHSLRLVSFTGVGAQEMLTASSFTLKQAIRMGGWDGEKAATLDGVWDRMEQLCESVVQCWESPLSKKGAAMLWEFEKKHTPFFALLCRIDGLVSEEGYSSIEEVEIEIEILHTNTLTESLEPLAPTGMHIKRIGQGYHVVGLWQGLKKFVTFRVLASQPQMMISIRTNTNRMLIPSMLISSDVYDWARIAALLLAAGEHSSKQPGSRSLGASKPAILSEYNRRSKEGRGHTNGSNSAMEEEEGNGQGKAHRKWGILGILLGLAAIGLIAVIVGVIMIVILLWYAYTNNFLNALQ
jgi:hypothetical protein